MSSSNWAGYADTNDTFNSVASSWTEPTVNCADSNSGLNGLLSLSGLLGGPGAASAFWVGLDGYNSTSVEQLGTDSDCDSGTPVVLRLVRDVPEPLRDAAQPVSSEAGRPDDGAGVVELGGHVVHAEIKDATAGWTFSTTQTGSGFARSSAEVIAEAPSSCSILFCSEVPLADFGQINYSGSSVINTAGTKGSLAAFNANEITMSDNGTTLATPSSLSSDGSSFSVSLERLVGRSTSRGRRPPSTTPGQSASPRRSPARASYSSSGPALAKPWRTPWPARAVSCSGS